MMHYIVSGVGSSFVEPLYPKKGDDVVIYCKALSKSVQWVRIAVVSDYSPDIMLRKDMQCKNIDGMWDVYSIKLPMQDNVLQYWFEASVDGVGEVYLSQKGESHVCPLNCDTFKLIADLQVPIWISHSVCYQIFPDRFANGNPNVGIKGNDYVFDGHMPKAMNWDDEPLQYEDGHCLDFFNGDLDGIASKVEHFKTLGVNVVYLNPIGCSRTTHRYDCTDYFHVDEKLGGDEAYIKMISRLHENGIKVVTDISINHTGIDNPWFQNALCGGEEKEFYYSNDKSSTANANTPEEKIATSKDSFDYWFGVKTLPQLNYKSSKLRELIYGSENSVLRKFLRPPFNQDGWRMDVATCVGVNGDDRMCHEIWQNVRKAIKKTNSQAYIVGECWEDASSFLNGDQWDATMNYVGCSRPLRSYMGEQDRYFCKNMNNPGRSKPYTAKELRDCLYYQLLSLPSQMVYQQMNLIDSHDIPRLYNHKEIFDKDIYFGAVMMQFVLPGMPSIYYGDEIALSGPMGTAENCRYPMKWDTSKWNMDFFEFYCSLGRLRSSYKKALGTGLWEFGYCDDEVLEFTRFEGPSFEKDDNLQSVKLVMYKGNNERKIEASQIDVKGYKDWFTKESINSSFTLKPKQSRLFVKN